jgi:hypothetical protein
VVAEGIEGAVTLAAAVCTWPVSKRWLASWGSSGPERMRAWVGDALVSETHEVWTRAIDIAAPAESVWPWIAQLGMDRGGFYSYELLERIGGMRVTNLESIEPSMQAIAAGDSILFHPKMPRFQVRLLEEGRHLCFGDRDRSWSIYIEPVTDDSCRMLIRSCHAHAMKPLSVAFEAPLDFTMEQRMLRTVKRLAEHGP